MFNTTERVAWALEEVTVAVKLPVPSLYDGKKQVELQHYPFFSVSPPSLSPPLPPVEVWVSHVETPGEFYVHLKNEEDDLQAMALQLNELCSKDSSGVDKKTLKEGKDDITVATVRMCIGR